MTRKLLEYSYATLQDVIFQIDGRLLGMLLRVVDGGHELFVMPIWRILKFIDMVDRAKQAGVDPAGPLITVSPGTTMNE